MALAAQPHDAFQAGDALDATSTQLAKDRPHSFDMTIELERELQNELEPSANGRPVSMDPTVLMGIVANLRQELLELTKERDGLTERLSRTNEREAELKEALDLTTERCTALSAELEELKAKSQADDEQISMLRTKVEESRRGLMRLQSESKRASMSSMSLDTARANTFFGTTPTSAKRASFTPLTGSGASRMHPHRRTSSISEPAAPGVENGADAIGLHYSPGSRVVSLPEGIDECEDDDDGEKKSRRRSGFFGGLSKSAPSPPVLTRQLTPEPPVEKLAAEMQALKAERDSARVALERAQRELLEVREAREASEHCVTALRRFISDHAVGDDSSTQVKLPPLPSETMTKEEEEAFESRRKPSLGSGWSLKLWRMDTLSTASKSSGGTESTAVSPPAVDTPSTATATTAASLSKKLGGLFSSRASVSSQNSNPQLPAYLAQEPMLNGSDASSLDEPAEPVSPILDHAHRAVLIQETHDSAAAGEDAGTSLDPVSAKVSVPQPDVVAAI